MKNRIFFYFFATSLRGFFVHLFFYRVVLHKVHWLAREIEGNDRTIKIVIKTTFIKMWENIVIRTEIIVFYDYISS